MTAKRFKHSEIIQDDGQTICYGIEDTQTRHIFNVIGEGIYDVSEKELIKLLNELHEENEELKSEIAKLSYANEDLLEEKRQWKILSDKYAELYDENEQLKQFKEDVFNKIDMHLRMLPTARDNEFNEENGDPSLYIGAIYMLETLKKELEE